MDIKDKIVGLALVALVSLIGWNLHATWDLKSEVMNIQQDQKVLHKKINKVINILIFLCSMYLSSVIPDFGFLVSITL